MAARKTQDRKQKNQYIEKQEVKLKREPKTVVVDRELERIRNENGRIDQKTILQDAKNPKSALHKYFEWDDSVAGLKYRMDQAYRLIQLSKYVYLTQERRQQEKQTQRFATLPKPPVVRKYIRSSQGGFTVREDALEDVDSRALFIESRRSELVGWCGRVADIPELDHIREWLEKELDIGKAKAA